MTTIIANMSDSAIADQAAKAAKGAESAGMKAILLATILFRVRGFSKATEGALYTAMAVAGVKESSAQNYISRARAASLDKWFPWAIDVNKPLEDVRESIQPEFTTFWGGINAIKKGGPDSKGNGRKGKDKNETGSGETGSGETGSGETGSGETGSGETGNGTVTLERLAMAVTSKLTALPTDMLLAMRAAIDAEIARRSEVEKAAA